MNLIEDISRVLWEPFLHQLCSRNRDVPVRLAFPEHERGTLRTEEQPLLGIALSGMGLERGAIAITLGPREDQARRFCHVIPTPRRLLLLEADGGAARALAIEDRSGRKTWMFFPS